MIKISNNKTPLGFGLNPLETKINTPRNRWKNLHIKKNKWY